MSANNNSNESKHVYKYFRGKWKELGSDNKSLPRIEETEYNVKDLENKSVIELEELIFRQEKLLQNKLFLSKLKDNGSKIKKKYKDLQKALKIAKEKNDPKNLEVNNHHHLEDIDSIEWNGVKKSPSNLYNNNSAEEHNEGDEEINPLQLLARHSVEYPCRIQERREEEDSLKIIEKELEKLNIEDSKESTETNVDSNDLSGENFSQKLLNTLKEKENSNKKTETFKPYRPKNSNSILNKSAKMKNYFDAAKDLKNSEPINMTLPSTNYLNYRDANSEEHILDEDEDDDVTSQFLYFGRVTED
ncbi:hypothetical protein Avbf_01497 [Armadillidium vulgare]|nr:hypothetical protein Avbf_01497 [Armadillidium vulgare]